MGSLRAAVVARRAEGRPAAAEEHIGHQSVVGTAAGQGKAAHLPAVVDANIEPVELRHTVAGQRAAAGILVRPRAAEVLAHIGAAVEVPLTALSDQPGSLAGRPALRADWWRVLQLDGVPAAAAVQEKLKPNVMRVVELSVEELERQLAGNSSGELVVYYQLVDRKGWEHLLELPGQH